MEINKTLPAPVTFNVDDWLQDAALPEESALVYKRPDVIAELTDLKRQITLADRVSDAEQSAGDSSATAALLAQYAELLQTFSSSALTVYVRALTPDQLKDLRTSHDELTKDWEPKQANEDFGYHLLAAAISAVKPAGGQRTPAGFTPAAVKAMESALGNPQMQLILAARQTAQNAVPAVDADFLLRSSGTETGQE